MKKLICFLLGHKYELYRRISGTTREVKCARCKAEYGMNDDTQSVFPLTNDLRTAHDIILVKEFDKETVGLQRQVADYNQLLGEAKRLQNQLELSTNCVRKAALHSRVIEKWEGMKLIWAAFPDKVKAEIPEP